MIIILQTEFDVNYINRRLERIFASTNMDQTYQQIQQKHAKPTKKRKENEKEESAEGEWIVVKNKNTELTISISDFSKINRYYSHRSIQTYLRYILAQTVPNPMWLAIKRQSQIQQILYIDLQTECNLFQSMINNKQLPFLSSLVNETNKALFKCSNKVMRQQLWQCLLCTDKQQDIKEIDQNKYSNENLEKIDQNLYKKYLKYALTPEELKLHLYPNKDLPIYSEFYEIKNIEKNEAEWKNKILIVDCEMVSSQAGFQLARATIVNFQGEILFDQLFKPQVHIVNYNTQYSGITHQLIEKVTNTPENSLYPFLQTIITKDTILVGHSLENDLRAMKLIHKKVIDSAVLFMRKNGTKFKLKSLADKILKRKIQIGEHDSKQDCLATLHLIRAKIENDEQMVRKQYTVFKQLQGVKKNAALVDFAIDYEMKQFAANHYEKIDRYQKSANVLKIVKKYLRKEVCIPNLILTRIEKHPQTQWENYYQQFESSFKEFHSTIPKKTAIFLNCQVDPNIQILSAGQSLKPTSTIRNPCFVLAV